MKDDYSAAAWRGPMRKRRFKKICSIHPSKCSPIPCPPSGVSGGLKHPANLQYSIPHTISIVHKRRPKVKDCIETESSSNINKRKRASTGPHNTTTTQLLVKPQLFRAPAPNIPSCSSSSILPLGRPLALAPSLPRLATGRAIPKLSLQQSLPFLALLKL